MFSYDDIVMYDYKMSLTVARCLFVVNELGHFFNNLSVI